MSKLVITSTSEGTIKFVEGEEVEISLDQIRNKIFEIEQRKTELNADLANKLDELKTEEEVEFNTAKEELDKEIQLAQDKYNSLVENIRNGYGLKMELQLKTNEENKTELANLEKELVKLTTILRSVEPEVAKPVEEIKVEPAKEEPLLQQPELVQNRIIF